MKKFEYKTVWYEGKDLVYGDLDTRLNDLGQQGWEVICKITKEGLLLKREID